MATKNKYAYRSRISEDKLRQIVRLFAVDLDASQIAEVANLTRIIPLTDISLRSGKESPGTVRLNRLSAVRLRLMKAIWAHVGLEASKVGVREAKPSFSACLNAMGASTPKLYRLFKSRSPGHHQRPR